MAEENTGMSRGRKILVGFIVVLFLLTIGAYFFGVYYFTEHFLPGTQVNGFNCSYMTQEETEKLLAEKTSVYVLAIQTRGNGQESISADEIDLKYTSDGSVNRMLHEQKRFQWFLAFSQHKSWEVPSSVSYNLNKFEQVINALNCMQDNQEPYDAYIKQNDDGFEVVPEIEGTKIDKEKLQKDISNAVTTGITLVNLEVDGCYINPTVYGDELTEDCKQMNELTDVVITYDFSDRKETVDRTLIKEWLSRDEDGNLMLDRDAIASYVGQLASKYDTVGMERSFSTYDNRDITVSGGTYGWLIDQPQEADALYQAIMDKKTQVREPVYAQEAASRDTNDIGYSYVEVNLTARRLVLYKSGNPVVDTGISISSSTPDGVYSIEEKKNQQTVGNMMTDCWMSFTDDLGIYGDPGFEPGEATESEADSFGSSPESDFSSDMTDWSSTEGCIVLPEEAAQELYQNVETGMPVVIYK
nr:peptidoglycan binding domain-containing protein [uncultured Blautia sp.]